MPFENSEGHSEKDFEEASEITLSKLKALDDIYTEMKRELEEIIAQFPELNSQFDSSIVPA